MSLRFCSAFLLAFFQIGPAPNIAAAPAFQAEEPLPPPPMEYQPPPDADSLDDFLPPGATLTPLDVPAVGQTGLATVQTGSNSPFLLNPGNVVVVMEDDTFSKDVELQFTPLKVKEPDTTPTGSSTTQATASPGAIASAMSSATGTTPAATATAITISASTTGSATAPATSTAIPGEPTASTATATSAPPATATPAATQDITATDTTPPAGLQHLVAFQPEVVGPASDEPVTAFGRQVRIVVDLRQYGYHLDEDGGAFFLAYQDPQAPDEWIEVPITIYQRDGLISAEVPHFSTWATGWRPEGWTLQWQLPSADGFSGAATYGYALQLPQHALPHPPVHL